MLATWCCTQFLWKLTDSQGHFGSIAIVVSAGRPFRCTRSESDTDHLLPNAKPRFSQSPNRLSSRANSCIKQLVGLMAACLDFGHRRSFVDFFAARARLRERSGLSFLSQNWTRRGLPNVVRALLTSVRRHWEKDLSPIVRSVVLKTTCATELHHGVLTSSTHPMCVKLECLRQWNDEMSNSTFQLTDYRPDLFACCTRQVCSQQRLGRTLPVMSLVFWGKKQIVICVLTDANGDVDLEIGVRGDADCFLQPGLRISIAEAFRPPLFDGPQSIIP